MGESSKWSRHQRMMKKEHRKSYSKVLIALSLASFH